MIVHLGKLDNVFQTGAEMRRIVEMYGVQDLGRLASMPFLAFYTLVCALPYKEDIKGVETISRPAYTLDPSFAWRDCDDKSILIASWLHAHGLKKRFVATSTKPTKILHHVFVQLETAPLFIDATYLKNCIYLGKYPYFKKITKFLPLTPFF